jgi:hypothetical protein
MGFVQIISFRTDQHEAFRAIGQEWLDATEGKRTALRELSLVDRRDPRHRVQVVEFASYESAMENSDLPETGAAAEKYAAIGEGVEFLDLDLDEEYDVRTTLADAMRDALSSSIAPTTVFTDDVVLEGQFPEHLVRQEGADAFAAVLRAEAPARTFDRWVVTTTATGFVAEYAYRTVAEDSRLSLGLVLATVVRGRITRAVVTCAGAWDADTEARVLGAQSAMVSA